MHSFVIGMAANLKLADFLGNLIQIYNLQADIYENLELIIAYLIILFIT